MTQIRVVCKSCGDTWRILNWAFNYYLWMNIECLAVLICAAYLTTCTTWGLVFSEDCLSNFSHATTVQLWNNRTRITDLFANVSPPRLISRGTNVETLKTRFDWIHQRVTSLVGLFSLSGWQKTSVSITSASLSMWYPAKISPTLRLTTSHRDLWSCNRQIIMKGAT